jgi:hypothetical protein
LWLKGEPIYVVLLDPKRTRTLSQSQGMSAELIGDGVRSNINSLVYDGTIRSRLSEEEIAWLKELQDNNGGNQGE